MKNYSGSDRHLDDCSFTGKIVFRSIEFSPVYLFLILSISAFSNSIYSAPEKEIQIKQSVSSEITGLLSYLIESSLKNSPDLSVTDADSTLQTRLKKTTHFTQYLPAVDIFGSQWLIRQQEQLRPNFRTGLGSDEQFTGNNGVLKTLGLQATFDLQKMFGPESILSEEHEYFSEIKKRLARRDTIRSVKNYYTSIYILRSLIREIEESIRFLASLKIIVRGLKASGVYTLTEENSIKNELRYLRNDLIMKRNEEKVLYARLSIISGISGEELFKDFSQRVDNPPYIFTTLTESKLNSLSKKEDRDILKELGKDYNISKTEYEAHVSISLPTIILRRFDQWNSVQVSPGNNHSVEVAFVFPLTGFLTRNSHKHELESKVEKSKTMMNRNIQEYRSSIQLSGGHFIDLWKEHKDLEADRIDAKKTLNTSLVLYRQRRIDATTISDLCRKYIDLTYLYYHQMDNLYKLDSELEYLTGESKNE